MDKNQLESILTNARIGADGKPFDREAFEKGPKGFDQLLDEATGENREVILSLEADGCPSKYSSHVLVYALWKEKLCGEVYRILPDGTKIMSKAEGQLISETARIGEPHPVTAWYGVIEELWKHLRKYRIAISPKDFRFIGPGIPQQPRPSTVYIGWRARRTVYHAVWDLSHLKEMPWAHGLDFEDTGTILHADWFDASPEFLAALARNEQILRDVPKPQPMVYVGA